MRITVAASAASLNSLETLLAEYHRRFTLNINETHGDVPETKVLTHLVSETDALLLVGSRRRSPRTVLPGPVLAADDGRLVPVGWLPDTGSKPLKRFAESAASVHRRTIAPPGRQVMAVLSQWHPRYLELAHRIEGLLGREQEEIAVMPWEADQLLREDLVAGLGCGLASAFYVGHGRPVGWVGYHGTRAHHFLTNSGHPLGVLFSLCCATASRKRNGLSFSEALPLMGRTAACFGAVKPTLHADNTRWALGLCSGINQGVRTLGELVVKAMPTSPSAIEGYRILGDPLAPLEADVDAYRQSQKIGNYDEYLTT